LIGLTFVLPFFMVGQLVLAQAITPFPPNSSKTLGTSLPDVRFTDDSGKAFLLSDLRGRPVLLNPVFASCKMTCSPIIQSLKKALPPNLKLGADYQVLTFSFDPEDDKDRMAALRKQHNLPPEWTLAVGNADEVRKLLDAVDFRYLTLEEEGFAHSNFIVAADAQQKIQFYLLGVNHEPAMVARALEMAQGRGQWKENARVVFFFVSLAGLLAAIGLLLRTLARVKSKRPNLSLFKTTL
jgi:protein SCO1